MRLALFAIGWLVLATAAPAAPNFVFLLVDDLGWADLGCYGSSYHKTPHIDALAASGVRFTDAYAACPVCSPTRASILSGKYPARVGITDWIPGDDPKQRPLVGPADLHALPPAEVTFAEVLIQAGYQTYYTGKWHLGEQNERVAPTGQGFDRYVPAAEVGDWKTDATVTDRLTDRAITWLESLDSTRPFLLYFAYHRVHTPIIGHPDYLEDYQRRRPTVRSPDMIVEHTGRTRPRQDNPAYAADLQGVDASVGRIVASIAEIGLEDETIIVFFSDNGGLSTLRRPGPTCNLPLRAGKGWLYEGGIRVPLVVRVPGTTTAGRVCRVPVTSTDFYPTLLELAGLPKRPQQHVDGVSLVPLLKGATSLDRSTLYWHYPHYHGSTWTPGAALRDGDFKLIEFYDPPAVELYDLASDLGEQSDLSQRQPDRTAALLDKLHTWQQAVGAKLPKPNPRFKE
jgi:arylsulfatase A-like enzyme